MLERNHSGRAVGSTEISEAVYREIEAVKDFDEVFREMVGEEARQTDAEHAVRIRELSAKIARNERELANVARFIREGSQSPTIRTELEQLEKEKFELALELSELKNRPVDNFVIPTAEEIRLLARDVFQGLALESHEFGKLIRCLIPRIIVMPYRLCDGGHIVLRSRFRLCLSGLLPDRRPRSPGRTATVPCRWICSTPASARPSESKLLLFGPRSILKPAGITRNPK